MSDPQEILETLRSQILAPIPTPALASLRGLADQMEKVLLLALENYGSTFVEPKVELGARFGHLVCEYTFFRPDPSPLPMNGPIPASFDHSS